MARDRTPIDPRLVAFFVVIVCVVFFITALTAVVRDKAIDREWFILLGMMAGGLLSFEAVRRR